MQGLNYAKNAETFLWTMGSAYPRAGMMSECRCLGAQSHLVIMVLPCFPVRTGF
jgi:hypothetical protein